MQNRRRKRLSSSPCRVVKRARSMDRGEMRPFIKQIELLKTEKYELEQKIKNFQNSEYQNESSNPYDCVIQSKLDSLEDENSTLHQQVAEFQIQADHQNAEIMTLRHQRDAAIEQLASTNGQMVNQASTNERLETQLGHVTQNAGAVEFAKNMLSESLREMIRDYQNLSTAHAAQTALLAGENAAIKGEMRKMEASCKEGALKIAQTAKSELRKLHEENFRLKNLMEEVMDKSDKPVLSLVKCSICLGVKNLTEFSISNPCGHVHCKSCTQKLTSSKKNKNCPSCRGPVTTMVKIFG